MKSLEFGSLISAVTLYIGGKQGNSVVLTGKRVLHIRGSPFRPADVHIGLRVFGRSRATAGKFLMREQSTGTFDGSIPTRQFWAFRGRTAETSTVDMEVFSCLCFIAAPTLTLDASSVEIETPAQ